MAYLKQWRRYDAEVRALVNASSSSSDEVDGRLQSISDGDRYGSPPFGADNQGSSCMEIESDTIFDCEFPEIVLSSSDSEQYDNDMFEGSDTGAAENYPDLGDELAAWANTNKITRSGLNEMLDILRRHGHRLPKDARTLLQTPRLVVTEEKCGGQYCYFGIESGLLRTLAQNPLFAERDDSIDLTVNIDGLPLFKSSNIQLWPVLCKFDHFDPFLVALYCGHTKPNSVQEYLSDFLHELQQLQGNGVTREGKTFQLTVRCFVCDAPARAFLKCTKAHNAYFACERCTIKGSWKGRVVFDSEETFPARTEQDFNNVRYENQLAKSPLIDAGILCIAHFPLDYMHLVCLGVVRRMLCFLRQGPKTCRLSCGQLSQISDKLMSLRGKMPSEFARQPRSLCELDRWKATEFRQFLLYTGPVVLRSVVSDEFYRHFIALSVAMSILLDSNDEKRYVYLQYARELLTFFVRKCPKIYGDIFVVYNVHNLLHLADDVEFYKCSLNEIAAFEFENYLQSLKKMVRKSQNPIAQVAKRLTELENSRATSTDKSIIRHISTRAKDRCFMLKSKEFVIVKEKNPDGKFVCDLIKLRFLESFYSRPCDSKMINICFVRDMDRIVSRRLLEKVELYRKVACLPYKKGHVLFPLLHDAEH